MEGVGWRRGLPHKPNPPWTASQQRPAFLAATWADLASVQAWSDLRREKEEYPRAFGSPSIEDPSVLGELTSKAMLRSERGHRLFHDAGTIARSLH